MIKVIIDRTIAEGFGPHYDTILQQSTALVEKAPGFLGCESLKDCNNPNHRITFSLWDNEHTWRQWLKSEHRKALQAKLDPMLVFDEKITVLKR
ncbi:hypothetical protein GCM10023116_24150 [Kistimonas scapharcae]|uniref:ABM domain-containing protein n=1 Tax=Kistimonas scapharcae TaxID=1036133 RepID=A0ABP8V5D6_9GAMM